ncbi:MAG: HEAT repeat domain-containing protein [Acidimicrobiales bacterium]
MAPGAGAAGEDGPVPSQSPEDRRMAVLVAGHRGAAPVAAGALKDPDPGVRAAALGALARCQRLDVASLVAAIVDPSGGVRRRACELAADLDTELAAAPGAGTAPGAGGAPDDLDAALTTALADTEPLVAEAACWALGERHRVGAVDDLAAMAGTHPDVRCREAAVAALGAIGHRSGLPAVLAALGDKPTIRRRATVALAAFDGPQADEALRRSAQDRDWQVREVAEILLDDGP